MNRLPESPMKMEAGWRLKGRKPRMAPRNATTRNVMRALWLTIAATRIIKRREARRAGGQAIQTVNEIEGIGDQQHPEEGERQVEDGAEEVRVEEGMEEVDADAAEIKERWQREPAPRSWPIGLSGFRSS